MTRYLLFLCVFLQILCARGQSPEVDSLRILLGSASGTFKADVLNELSVASAHYDLQQTFTYADQAYELSDQLDYNFGKRYALMQKGLSVFTRGQYAEALGYYSLSSALEQGDDDLKAYNLVMIGNVFRATADNDSAIYFFREAISLEKKLKSDKYLAYAYKNLARVYMSQWKNKEAEYYLNKAIELYQKKNNPVALADTWFSLSEVKLNMTEFDQANELIRKACGTATKENDDLLMLYCAISQGETKFNDGQFTLALEDYTRAIEIIKRMDFSQLLARIYNNMGDAYEGLDQNDIALKYYLESLKVAERIGVKQEIAGVLSNISWIYKNQNNLRLAHQYIDQSLVLRIEIGDEHGISNCYNIRGLIYLVEKKYNHSLKALDEALAIRKKIGHRTGISECIFNKALVLKQLKQYKEALGLQLESLGIERQIANKFNLGVSYNSIGDLYTLLGNYEKADEFLSLGEKMARYVNSKSLLMQNYLHRAEYHEAKGDDGRALKFHKDYAALNDSIYNEVSAGKLAELQAFYQIGKKDDEIRLLNQDKKLKDNEIALQRSRINLQKIIIISVVLGLLLISILALKVRQYNRRIKKANSDILEKNEEIRSQSEELIEANTTIANINKELEYKIEHRTQALTQAYKELDTFFYRSSHDFRRPLTTFLGLAEVANVTVKDPNALDLFEKVRETAVNLDKMLVKLQSISDVGSQELVFKEVLVKEIFDNLSHSFSKELKKKNIKTITDLRLNHPFISYPAMVRTIIENLFENAIQFCGVEDCFIRLKAYENGQYVIMEIQDNGQGISREYIDQVFDMYFRASERSKGNGLGLYIVKKAVEKLDGKIKVSSIAGAGSTFTVMLPNNFRADHTFHPVGVLHSISNSTDPVK